MRNVESLISQASQVIKLKDFDLLVQFSKVNVDYYLKNSTFVEWH